MATYRVVLTPAADRQLARLKGSARELVAAGIAALTSNPRPAGCVKLTGADDLWRVRIRDYRIIYTIRDDQLLVVVVKVGDRKDVYR